MVPVGSESRRSAQAAELHCAQQSPPEVEAADGTIAGFWEKVEVMKVYGLGSLETSHPARYQLALALVLSSDLLPGLKCPVEVYDPIFTEVDKHVLRTFACKVSPHQSLQAFLTSLAYHCFPLKEHTDPTSPGCNSYFYKFAE